MSLWTVVRWPNGSWSYGGKIDDPDYESCEKWRIDAPTAEKAVKRAQAKRSRERYKFRAAATTNERTP